MSPDELEEFALITAGALSPGSADDKSSFTTTPRPGDARYRRPVIPERSARDPEAGIFESIFDADAIDILLG